MSTIYNIYLWIDGNCFFLSGGGQEHGALVRLFPRNVKTAEPIHILCGTSHDPREGLWMLRIKKSSVKIFCFIKEEMLKDWAHI